MQFKVDFLTAIKIQEAIFGNVDYGGYSFKIANDSGNNIMMLELLPSNGVYEDLSARTAFNLMLDKVGKTSEKVNPIFVSNNDLSTRLGFGI